MMKPPSKKQNSYPKEMDKKGVKKGDMQKCHGTKKK